MSLAKIKKIQFIGIKDQKEKILEVLQDCGTLEINEVKNSERNSVDLTGVQDKLNKIDLLYANLDFAINLLSPYENKKEKVKDSLSLSRGEIEDRVKLFNYEELIDTCYKLEDSLTKAKNSISLIGDNVLVLESLENLNINLEDLKGTVSVDVVLGQMKNNLFVDFNVALAELSDLVSLTIVKQSSSETFFYLIYEKGLKKEVQKLLLENKFVKADLPNVDGLMSDYLKSQRAEIKEKEKIIKKNESELLKLSKKLDDFKIVHDYFMWEKEKLEMSLNLSSTDFSIVFNAWIPEHNIEQVKEMIEKETKYYSLLELEPDEGENPPVVIRNNSFFQPFEAVTTLYGLPLHTELDPTPYLSAFFIIFFALCLTDAGYGVVMFIVMASILKFFRLPKETAKLVKLLMYAGVATFFIGALFGGWFGLEASNVPESLTYTKNGEKFFLFQVVNSLKDPITVLILALGLGYFQIFLGTFMKFAHSFKYVSKKDAILDTGTWVFMLTGIAVFVLGASSVLAPVFAVIGKWWVISAAVLLILTQGRRSKSIFGKLFSGVLSLYNLVGYMSDILSYSRLLALGLATAIIGLAVNVIAALVLDIQYIGWIFATIIFIGGHTFNLVINSLGSFIHSGRLQFVEFFGRFMEGGGRRFIPFSKKTKYIHIKK